jgi:hypothetical protein
MPPGENCGVAHGVEQDFSPAEKALNQSASAAAVPVQPGISICQHKTRHFIFFSRFSQQTPEKTNKNSYTLSPFAYMLYAMNLSARSSKNKYAAFSWTFLMQFPSL